MFQKNMRNVRPYNAIRTTNKQTEYKISKKLQSFFFPFNFLESLLFSSKYQIHDNIIKPNGFKATAFCVVGNFFVIAVWFWRGLTADEFMHKVKSRLSVTDKLQNLFASILYNLNYSFFAVGFLVNMVISVAQRRNMVKIVVKIQKILFFVNLNDKIFNRLILRNWIFVFSIITLFLCYYGTLHCYFAVESWTVSFWKFISDIPLMIFDVHMTLAMSVVILLRHIALEIIDVINCKNNNEFRKNICGVYIEMLQVFDIYNAVFQDLIFYNITIIFYYSVSAVEYSMILLSRATGIESGILIWIIIVFLSVKRMLLLILLAEEEEKLYELFIKIRTISNRLVGSQQCSDAERRMHKNINRSFKTMFKKTNIRGFFDVDVNLPLELMLSLTLYIVVVLQFDISA